MTAGMGCHAGRYSLQAADAPTEPKKGLTGDAHSQIKRPVSAFTAGFPLPGTAHECAPGKPDGAIAQLGERLLCKQEVVGSIPITSRTLIFFVYKTELFENLREGNKY